MRLTSKSAPELVNTLPKARPKDLVVVLDPVSSSHRESRSQGGLGLI